MEQQLLTFTTTSENIAATAAHLKALPATPEKYGGKVYR
jgi:hypothetical protein